MDFGLSNVMQAGAFFHSTVGTPLYSAPEILGCKSYIGPEVDVWSLGCIVYSMATGNCPWSGATVPDQVKNAIQGLYDFPEGVSTEFIKLVARILTVDPMKRPTIRELRNNTWVNRGYGQKPLSTIPSVDRPLANLDEDILEKMRALGYKIQQIKQEIADKNTTSQEYFLYYMMNDNKLANLEESLQVTTDLKSLSHSKKASSTGRSFLAEIKKRLHQSKKNKDTRSS